MISTAGTGVGVGVLVGVGVGVLVGVGVGVLVGVGLGLGVGVNVGTGVAVGLGVLVAVGVSVIVGCSIGLTVCCGPVTGLLWHPVNANAIKKIITNPYFFIPINNLSVISHHTSLLYPRTSLFAIYCLYSSRISTKKRNRKMRFLFLCNELFYGNVINVNAALFR